MTARGRLLGERASLAGALLLTLLFALYCVRLMQDVARERAEVAARAGWLRQAQELARTPDAGRLDALRREVAARPGCGALADHLAAGALDDFTTGARAELTSLSAQLGARWDALNRVALLALALAALATALLWRSQHRRRVTESLRAELATTVAELSASHTAAERADQLKSDLLAYVSHEFRTPMQAIIGISGQLAAPRLDDRQRLLHAATLRATSEGLLRLVDEILDLSRIERRQLTLRSKSFAPGPLFAETSASLRGQAAERGLELTCELAPELPSGLLGDAWRIKQVVVNLVASAIKLSRRGPVRLRVGARAEDRHAHLTVEVAGTGPGIPAEQLQELFRPFGRLPGEGGRLAGSGLGLAISRHIIEQLGGTIEIVNTPAGGPTFRCEFVLPTTEPPAPAKTPPPIAVAPAEARPTTSPPSGEPTPRGRVLVADDDLVMREVLSRMLARIGYAVDAVSDGRAALQKTTEHAYAAVLLDVEMPEMDGPTAASRIRGQGGTMALLALTAQSGLTETLRCREAGIDAVLAKPVTLERLESALEREIDARTSGVDLSVIRTLIAGAEARDGVALLDVFEREMQRDLAALVEGVSQDDRAAVRRGTHRLEGSSSAFGADALSKACAALGAAARGSEAMTDALAALTDAAARASAAFARERERLLEARRDDGTSLAR